MTTRRQFLHASAALGILAASPFALARNARTARLSVQQRVAAASQTALTAAACVAVQPFYWQIGNASGVQGGASVGSSAAKPDTVMQIASASKWTWGACMVQKGISTADVPYLNFTSGYCNMVEQDFPSDATVDSVLYTGNNAAQTSLAVGKFLYNGGHMQMQAHDQFLGADGTQGFASDLQRVIVNMGFLCSQPVPSGGIMASANQYAAFLRAILGGQLKMHDSLGTYAVPTNPLFHPGQALGGPMPDDEDMHYSLGHWVEDDPVKGDGAFSSAGAFGFYPWIDATKQWYGIVARTTTASNAGVASMYAGRAIRKAWMTGTVQA